MMAPAPSVCPGAERRPPLPSAALRGCDRPEEMSSESRTKGATNKRSNFLHRVISGLQTKCPKAS